MEVYRAMRAGDGKRLNDARHDFLSVSRELRHGHPMLVEMMGPTDEDAYMALRHLPMIADEFLHRLKARNPKDDVEVVAGKNGGEVSEKKK